MMNRTVLSRSILLLFICLSFSAAHAAKQSYYRWLDSNGSAAYGKAPPIGVDATLIDIHTGRAVPIAVSSVQEQQESQKQTLPTVESQLEPGEAKRLCELAKKNLALMKGAGLIRMKNEEGEPVVLDAEARQQQVDDANEAIKIYCPQV